MFKKAVVLAVCAGLLGQNMLFAQQHQTNIPLAKVQNQARQDYAALQASSGDSYVVPLLLFSAMIAVGLAALAPKNWRAARASSNTSTRSTEGTFSLRNEKIRLHQLLEQVEKETFPDEFQRKLFPKEMDLFLAPFSMQHVSHHDIDQAYTERDLKFLEKRILRKQAQAQARNVNLYLTTLQEQTGWKPFAKSKRTVTPELQKHFEQRIKALVEHMTAGNNPVLMGPIDEIAAAKVAKYADLFDPSLPAKKQRILWKSLKTENWLTPQTYEDIQQLANGYGLFYPEKLTDVLRNKTFFRNKHVIALLHQVLKKGSVAVLALVVAGMMYPSDAQANAESQKQAARITGNVNLFLKATPEQLAQLEANPATYEACMNQAAILNFLVQNADLQKAAEKRIQKTYTERLKSAAVQAR